MMSVAAETSTQPQWPQASRKRRVLAAYLDFLLLGAPWAIVMWALGKQLPQMHQASFPMKVVVFLALEAILLSKVKWSPGQACLGIVARRRSPFASSSDASTGASDYLVDPWLYANERWWTILFGIFAVLNGTKALVRWTMWHAPVPLLGFEQPPEMSIAVQMILGAVEVFVGVAVLRLRFLAVPVGLVLHGFHLVSTLASWKLFPEWIREYVTNRRAYLGASPRPGEIEFMQAVMPTVLVVTAVVAVAWLFLVGRRLRRARMV